MPWLYARYLMLCRACTRHDHLTDMPRPDHYLDASLHLQNKTVTLHKHAVSGWFDTPYLLFCPRTGSVSDQITVTAKRKTEHIN